MIMLWIDRKSVTMENRIVIISSFKFCNELFWYSFDSVTSCWSDDLFKCPNIKECEISTGKSRQKDSGKVVTQT